MANGSPEDVGRAQRRKFLRHFHAFDANARFPAPYAQFAGKPMALLAEQGWHYDVLGYRNYGHADARPASETLRVLLVGDSTMVEGRTFADTVAGRLEIALKRERGEGARVYNFGAISACLNQMTGLITSRLMDLQADVILVVGGGTDVFQPWSFDPRGGYPYNHFVSECLYNYFFDASGTDEIDDLSYDGLKGRIFAHLENLRALTHWQSDIWEWEIVRQFELALSRLARLSPGVGAPVRFALQPAVVRKATPVGEEAGVASADFLAYLDRQYGRLARVVGDLGGGALAGPHFAARDLSRIFEDDRRALFTDIVHYTADGRQEMAEALLGEVAEALAPRAAGA